MLTKEQNRRLSEQINQPSKPLILLRNDVFDYTQVLYALDAATGAELFTSGEAIDSWNHDGNIALSGGALYLSTYHGKVYAFGLRK